MPIFHLAVFEDDFDFLKHTSMIDSLKASIETIRSEAEAKLKDALDTKDKEHTTILGALQEKLTGT